MKSGKRTNSKTIRTRTLKRTLTPKKTRKTRKRRKRKQKSGKKRMS